MEENSDILFAGSDALLYLAGPMHKKNIPCHLFEAIHLVRTYLRTNFLTPRPPCMHMYAIRVTVTAVGLFQKILLNTTGHMF